MTTQTPTAWPTDLEPDVRAWYLKIAKDGGTIQSHQRSDLDWKEAKERNTDEREGRTTVRFNEDELKWTMALVDAGLATYSPSEIIEAVWITKIWGHASVARDGSDYDWYATVHLLDERSGANDRNGVVIAFLHGAELDRTGRDSVMPEWTLRVRHSTATDFEHDAVWLAAFKLTNVVIEDLNHVGTVSVLGVLNKAEMYGRDNDPIVNETPDNETDESWCDGYVDYPNGETHTPHPFAPYTVKDDEHKERLKKFKGRLVRIEMTPRALVDENGKLIRKSTDEEDD